MRLNPESARWNWCPFARLVLNNPTGATGGNNRLAGSRDDTSGADTLNETRCIAYRCMAWRWTEPWPDNPPADWTDEDRTGYCGLAGRPGYE